MTSVGSPKKQPRTSLSKRNHIDAFEKSTSQPVIQKDSKSSSRKKKAEIEIIDVEVAPKKSASVKVGKVSQSKADNAAIEGPFGGGEASRPATGSFFEVTKGPHAGEKFQLSRFLNDDSVAFLGRLDDDPNVLSMNRDEHISERFDSFNLLYL